MAQVISWLLTLALLGALGLVFRKAGQPWWAAFVPFYGLVVIARIAGRPWWHGILWLFPLATLPMIFILPIDLARTFGRSTAFGVGIALLSIVFLPILALSRDRYYGPLYSA